MSQRGDFFLTLSQQNNKGHLKESNIDLANNIRGKHITTRKCTKDTMLEHSLQACWPPTLSWSKVIREGGKITRGAMSNTIGTIVQYKEGLLG